MSLLRVAPAALAAWPWSPVADRPRRRPRRRPWRSRRPRRQRPRRRAAARSRASTTRSRPSCRSRLSAPSATPTQGEHVASGRGSGFVIDPSGIAVTNNHVVTGAASLKVWLGPDREEHAARVLGASECADLAVIEIDSVTTVPFLDWYEDEIRPGLDIYVAGFPLGEPEYTLTRGIVSRAHGILNENWAWVEDSIEHDATTNPGNSGGPVITADAQVVGVHYAGDPDTEQHWAIASDEARSVVDRLREGADLYSIGVNGEAFAGEAFTGIWVYSVKPGSPAARAGIAPRRHHHPALGRRPCRRRNVAGVLRDPAQPPTDRRDAGPGPAPRHRRGARGRDQRHRAEGDHELCPGRGHDRRLSRIHRPRPTTPARSAWSSRPPGPTSARRPGNTRAPTSAWLSLPLRTSMRGAMAGKCRACSSAPRTLWPASTHPQRSSP